MSMNPSSKGTLLLVDDDSFVTVAYKAGLEKAGYTVNVASDGEQAIAAIRQSTPDLVILDIIMPKMNGFEVLQTLRSEPLFADLPVIVHTNLNQQSDRDEAAQYGVIEYLTKSDASLNTLLESIDEFFRRRLVEHPPTNAPTQ